MSSKLRLFRSDPVTLIHTTSSASTLSLAKKNTTISFLWGTWADEYLMVFVGLPHQYIISFPSLTLCGRMTHMKYFQKWARVCCNRLLVNFTRIILGYLTATGAVIRLTQCQWSNLEEYVCIIHINLHDKVMDMIEWGWDMGCILFLWVQCFYKNLHDILSYGKYRCLLPNLK